MRIYIAEDDPSVIGVLEDILESSAEAESGYCRGDGYAPAVHHSG